MPLTQKEIEQTLQAVRSPQAEKIGRRLIEQTLRAAAEKLEPGSEQVVLEGAIRAVVGKPGVASSVVERAPEEPWICIKLPGNVEICVRPWW